MVWAILLPFVLSPVKTHMAGPWLTKLLCTVAPMRLGGSLSWPTGSELSSMCEMADLSMAICNSWVFSHHHLPCLPSIPPRRQAGSCLAQRTAQPHSKSACSTAGFVGKSPVLSTKAWASSMVRVTWLAPFHHEQVIHSRGVSPSLAENLVWRSINYL